MNDNYTISSSPRAKYPMLALILISIGTALFWTTVVFNPAQNIWLRVFVSIVTVYNFLHVYMTLFHPKLWWTSRKSS